MRRGFGDHGKLRFQMNAPNELPKNRGRLKLTTSLAVFRARGWTPSRS